MKLSPFPVDQETLNRIRPLQARDVPHVARLHRAAMGDSLWARLGDGFLTRLYQGLLTHPAFRGFVYEEDGRPRGFIAGSLDGRAMFRSVFLRRGPALALTIVPALLKDPALARLLLQTFSYFGRSGVGGTENIKAESLFCSFEPDLRGKRIAGLINKVLFDEIAAAGHRHVKITTEDNNRGAVRQLSSWGFEEAGRFDFYGKRMITWRLDLLKCERVKPVSRYNLEKR